MMIPGKLLEVIRATHAPRGAIETFSPVEPSIHRTIPNEGQLRVLHTTH